jgi:predicted nucleic acid-binding protein
LNAAFLDTSGWYATLNARESGHSKSVAAVAGWIQAGRCLVTTNLVVAEMQTLVCRGRGPAAGVRFLDNLYQDASCEVVFVDRELERSAVDRWLRRYGDQGFSLADAVSFEVMRERRIRDVLTLDKHFEVAGFRVVP